MLLKLKFQLECVLDLVSCLISLQGIGLLRFSDGTIHLPLLGALPWESECSYDDEKLNLPFDAPFIEALQEDVEMPSV